MTSDCGDGFQNVVALGADAEETSDGDASQAEAASRDSQGRVS